MSLSSKLIFGLCGVCVAGGALYYLFIPRRESPAIPFPSQPAATSTATPAAAPLREQSVAPSASFPMPDLGRPIAALVPLSTFALSDARRNITSLTEALRKNPDNVSAWVFLGVYRKTLGDYVAAEEIWLFVAKRWPTSYVTYNNLGNLYHEQLRDFPKAEEYFRKTIAVQPFFVQSYFNLYDLYRYSYTGHESKAVGALFDGLQKNPSDLNLILGLARHYAEAGAVASSSDYYTMAIQRAETDGKAVLAESLRKEAKERRVSI